MDPAVEKPRHCQLRIITQTGGWGSPLASVFTPEAANPRVLAVYTARLGLSGATGNVCLYPSTIALYDLPFGTRCTRPRVTNVCTRMVAAGELLITDVPTRNPLGGTGLQGGNVRALVRKHFAAAVTRNLACNLTGRTGPGMAEYRTRVAARSWSRTEVTARVRRCQSGGFRIGFRSTETPDESGHLAPN